MRTTAFAPPFPIDFGSWLGAFRHRVTDNRGNPYSAEQLGALLDVSGATVRRWENGRLRPNPEKVAELARIFELTSLQVTFLSRALRRNNPMPVPDRATFREKATPILGTEYPVFIMDSMMFIRGWNSYLPHFLSRRRSSPEDDYHLIDFLIEADDNNTVIEPVQRDRVRRAVMELWFLTADVCGSTEYQMLINRLSKYEVFREEWARLPFLEEEDCIQLGLPRRAWRADVGETLICPFAVVLPPVYQVRQFMPVDETSRARLEELRAEGPPEIVFDTRSHWAQTEGDGPFYRIT